MSRPLIVMGDKTSHGGTVISADLTFDINGKYVARVGDMTVCPKCKGTFPITSGPDDLVDGRGNGYARHMDSTACGAKLISGQITTTWSDESSSGDPAAEAKTDALATTSQIAASTSSGICLDCLLKAAATGSATVVRD
ncbi:PAAR domain-containing protein [Oxalobacteraceae bacterium]|nr:PAAR domain-containing protein [Oxalobacteraceae bacterium]